MEKRLSAIVALDIVGYSALVEHDETGTLDAVQRVFGTQLRPLVDARGGRVVKTMGDGALIVFDSALAAVCFSVEFQRRSRDDDQGQEFDFRIGINLGDVVFKDGDVFGNGVIVAARLEAVAEPGGICVALSTRDQIRDQLEIKFQDIGDVRVKNISRAIRAFNICLDETTYKLPETTPLAGRTRLARRVLIALGGVSVVVAAAMFTFHLGLWGGLTNSQNPSAETLANRPSIAVMPFQDLSEKRDQAYFGEGVANDIITELSRFDDLMVLASNSSFVFRDTGMSTEQIAKRLGATYVLAGDVRRAEGVVRLNLQLFDASSGRTLWADRMQEPVGQIFELQDRIVRTVVRKLVANVADIELERIDRRAPSNLEAYDFLLRGRALARRFTREDLLEARRAFGMAIKLEPDYASAHSELGFTHFHAIAYGWSAVPNADLDRAAGLARRTLEIDGKNVAGHRLLGRVLQFRGIYDAGVKELRQALSLNPNDGAVYRDLGVILLWSSETNEAVASLETALRFDPQMGPEGLFHLGLGYFLQDRYDDAVQVLTRSRERNRTFALTHVVLAAAYGRSGQTDKARRALDDVRRLDPFFTRNSVGGLFRSPSDAEKLRTGLVRAGLEDN